jgi:hypothetical protein
MRSHPFSRLVWLTVLFALAGAVLLGGAAWAARSGRSTALSSGTLTVSGALHGHWKLSKCTLEPVGTAPYPQPAVGMYFSGSASPPVVPLEITVFGARTSSKHVNLATTRTYGVGFAGAWVSGWSGSVLVERGSGTLSMSPTRTSGTVNTEMGVAGKAPGLIHVVASWNNCKPAG